MIRRNGGWHLCWKGGWHLFLLSTGLAGALDFEVILLVTYCGARNSGKSR